MKELKKLNLEPTSNTPLVDFNSSTGELILEGRSIPENANRVYEPCLNWINEYIKSPRQTTNLRLNLEYFNTASSIWIARIVKSLSQMSKSENILMIHLYFNLEDYDDMETDDIRDALAPVIDTISAATVSVGIKIYGTDENGEVVKESMVLI